MNKEYFEIKEEHIKLLRKANVRYDEYTEFGAPLIDPKRPYGNSDVYNDIAEILSIKRRNIEDGMKCFSPSQEKRMLDLHKETAMALQIILCVGVFEPGLYESEKYQCKWKKINR